MALVISTLESGLQVITPEPLAGDGGQALTDNFQLLNNHILGSGSQHVFGINIRTSETGVLTSDDRGQGFTNTGADSLVGFDLPNAAAGLEYTFIVDDTDGIKIIATNSATINISGNITAVDGNISSVTVGSTVTVLAINSTTWIVTNESGSWSIDT